jgi:integrase
MGKLTDLKAKNLPAGRHGDGDGLYLVVKPSGGRSWILRVMHDGRAQEIGLGGYTPGDKKEPGKLTLAQARAEAVKVRAEVKAGGNVVAERKAAKTQRMTANRHTFEKLAREVHEQRATRRNRKGFALTDKTNAAWLARLDDHAFKAIGAEPVAGLDVKAIRNVIRPLWHRTPETARKLFRGIAEVLDYGNGEGLCGPAPKLEAVAKGLGAQPEAKGRPSVPWQDAPAIIAKLMAKDETTGRLCLVFAALTGSRSAEARGATWAEIDLEAKIWNRPAERMKMREAHAVPLSDAALAILQKAKAARLQLSGGKPIKPADLVFPGKGGRPLADMTLLKAHKLEAPGTSVHGWRSTFASWAASATDYPAEVRELSLAHVGADKVARAYQRDDLLEKRRALMAGWAAYLTAEPAGGAKVGGNIVSLAGRRAAAKG